MTVDQIKNAEKAVKLLSEFGINEHDTPICQVGIYFGDSVAEQVFLYKIDTEVDEKKFLRWDEGLWRKFVWDGMVHYLYNSKFCPEEIVSLIVRFRTEESYLAKEYHVEATNLDKSGFDRLVIRDGEKLLEVPISKRDKYKLYRAKDTIDLAECKLETYGCKKISTDLPICCSPKIP